MPKPEDDERWTAYDLPSPHPVACNLTRDERQRFIMAGFCVVPMGYEPPLIDQYTHGWITLREFEERSRRAPSYGAAVDPDQ